MQRYVSANFRIFQKLAEILLTDGDHECQFDALIQIVTCLWVESESFLSLHKTGRKDLVVGSDWLDFRIMRPLECRYQAIVLCSSVITRL